MGTGTGPLATLVVAVGGGGDTLAAVQPIGVHAHTHRAARQPPLGTRAHEDLVQVLMLALLPAAHRTGDDKHAHCRCDPAPAKRPRRCAQVLYSAVGAAAKEY